MVGDKSDNIPGVDKIGPKTAILLLDKYGDLESIINNIDNIKGKISDNLLKSLDSIDIAKKLIKLKSDVGIDTNIKNYTISNKDEKSLANLVSKYQLKSLADTFEITKTTNNINSKKSYKIIDNEIDLKKLLSSLKKNKIFLMQLNRFMWEDVEKGVFRKNKRIRTILKFENVIEVNSKNISQTNKDKFLDFLAIESNQMPDNNYEMKLIFSGDSIIRVVAEVIEVALDDQGEPWDSKNKPKHKVL